MIKDLEDRESAVSQEAATYALHRLADSLETHMLMLRCDVLPPTLPLLGTASPKTQQYAASLLVALATGEKSARRAMLALDVFGKVRLGSMHRRMAQPACRNPADGATLIQKL